MLIIPYYYYYNLSLILFSNFLLYKMLINLCDIFKSQNKYKRSYAKILAVY